MQDLFVFLKNHTSALEFTAFTGFIRLQVQRSWMYLENIFIGSEDIRKQLPQESLMFEEVHVGFMQAMRELQAASNVVRATTAHGVPATFQVRYAARCSIELRCSCAQDFTCVHIRTVATTSLVLPMLVAEYHSLFSCVQTHNSPQT